MKMLMLEDGIITTKEKFLDCGNAIQLILLACMKLKWHLLEIEKLIDKVSQLIIPLTPVVSFSQRNPLGPIGLLKSI